MTWSEPIASFQGRGRPRPGISIPRRSSQFPASLQCGGGCAKWAVPAWRRSSAAFDYLFGCASLEESDPAAALALYEYFRRNNMVSDRLSAVPRPGFELDPVDPSEVEHCLEERGPGMIRTLPPLFKGYIKLGAKVCGPPAYDREFGTIDFLILLDMREIPERYAKHFVK